MTTLLCPLCSQPRFDNLESLRLSLINAATQSISCPICNEIVLGLDKLTIHLFSHTLDTNSKGTQCLNLNTFNSELFECSNDCSSKGVFVNYTNDTNDCGINITNDTDSKNLDQYTFSVEDAALLTSWESLLEPGSSKYSESKNIILSEETKNKEEVSQLCKEDSAHLSEYISDLFNKKLPVVNFGCSTNVSGKTEISGLLKSVENTTVSESTSQTPTTYLKPDDFCNILQAKVSTEDKDKPLKRFQIPMNVNSCTDVFRDLVFPRYNCHLCSKSFKMKGNLLVHYRVAHIGLGVTDPGTETSSSVKYDSSEKSFVCSICSKGFKKEQQLTQHIKTHEGKKWRCNTCSKSFTTKYFLKKHQRLHTGEMPYSCKLCNKTFTFQQSYRKHLLYHSDEKPHQCSECGRAFKELSTLHNHQRIHSGEKPFECETCGKCFRQRVSYIVHRRIHTGVLPYECAECSKKFRYKVSQRSHKCSAQSLDFKCLQTL